MVSCEITILFAILTISLANQMQNDIGDGPQRCCLPSQFTSRLTTSVSLQLDGITFLTYGDYIFSYDQQLGLFASRGVLSFPTQLRVANVSFFEVVSSGLLYTYFSDTKQCYVSTRTPQPTCLPEEASLLYSSYFGDPGNQFLTDTWLYSNGDTLSYATFGRESCFPLTKVDYLRSPETVTTSMIYGLVPFVLDPSIFDIPPECQHLA